MLVSFTCDLFIFNATVTRVFKKYVTYNVACHLK